MQTRDAGSLGSDGEADGRAETESRNQDRPPRKFRREIIERSPHGILLATPFVVNSFAQPNATEVETQDRNAKLVQRLRRLKDDFVVHRPAKQWMRMADHCDEWRLGSQRRPEQRLETALRSGEKKTGMG